MADIIPFSCTHCGSETFTASSPVKTYKDFLGAVCAKCGAVVKEDDIKKKGLKIADDLVRDAFKKAGFTD